MIITFATLFIIFKAFLLIFIGLGLIFILVIVELILFGSTVDPDDNGILRTKVQKEIYRQKKLNKRSENVR